MRGLNIFLAVGFWLTVAPVWAAGTLTPAAGGGGSSLTVQEVDGSPSVANPTALKFTNGSVTDNGDGTATVATGSGTGAPTDAEYWTGAANVTLSAEKNLGALGTGLVINTAGVPSIYAGQTCTNQVVRILGASGAATCATITSAFVDTSVWTGTVSSGMLKASSQGVLAQATAGTDYVAGTPGTTANAVPRASGTGGTTLKASGVTIDDSNNVTVPGDLIVTGTLTLGNGTDPTKHDMIEGAAPSAPASAGHHFFYVDSTTNRLGTIENGGSAKDYLTAADTQTVTNKTIDCSTAGNVCTITKRFGGDLVGTSGGTAGHVWNEDPLSTTCTPASIVGTNRAIGACTFPDSDGDYGRQLTEELPTGYVAASLIAKIWWKTTGTGNARFQIQTKCYADDEADDASFNTATVTTAAAGTSARPNTVTTAAITDTGCAGGELLRVRVFRNRTEASDTLNAALDVEKVTFYYTEAQ